MKKILGRHFILELMGCDFEILDNYNKINNILEEFCINLDLAKIGQLHHKFQPQGVTIVIGITESHISIHTWPEFGYAALDIFTCNMEKDFETQIFDLINKMKCKEYNLKVLSRGINNSKSVKEEEKEDERT